MARTGRNSRLSFKRTTRNINIRETAIVLRSDSIQTPHRRRRQTAKGKSGKRRAIKLITSKNLDICSCSRIKGYRPSCRTVATGLQQEDEIDLKSELNILKEVVTEMGKKIVSLETKMGKKIVSLETKIRTMIPVQKLMNYPAASPPPPPPPPPPPMPASIPSLYHPYMPSITTQDLKKIKLRKTGLLHSLG